MRDVPCEDTPNLSHSFMSACFEYCLGIGLLKNRVTATNNIGIITNVDRKNISRHFVRLVSYF
jgi:hypothetical protein